MIAERERPQAVLVEWLDCSALELLGADRDFYERYDLGSFIWAEKPSKEIAARQKRFFGILDPLVNGAAQMRQAANSRVDGLSSMLASELAGDKEFDRYCRSFKRETHDWPGLCRAGARAILYAYCVNRKGH
jgi:hypothetical protein